MMIRAMARDSRIRLSGRGDKWATGVAHVCGIVELLRCCVRFIDKLSINLTLKGNRATFLRLAGCWRLLCPTGLERYPGMWRRHGSSQLIDRQSAG